MNEEREKEIDKKAMDFALEIFGNVIDENDLTAQIAAKSFKNGYIRALNDEHDNYCKRNSEIIKKYLEANAENFKSNPYYALGVCKTIFTILAGEKIEFEVN